MSSQFGVVVNREAKAARPIPLSSSTVIGLIGTAEGLDPELKYYGDLKAAMNDFKDKAGTLFPALEDLSRQNVSCPLLLSLSKSDAEGEVVKAGDQLMNASGVFKVKPDLLLAPGFSHLDPVAAKIGSLGSYFRATGIVDCGGENETTVIAWAKKYVSERLLACYPALLVEKQKGRPYSTFVAGRIAKTDAAWEYGWADSFSNRPIEGIIGLAKEVNFVPGENCEADRLRMNGVTTAIAYQGFRTWGGETRSPDPLWKSITRVRIFDRIMSAAQESLLWAIDRRADILKSAQDSVEQLLLNLKGANVLMGFNVFWDPEKNTRTNITDGKFYLTAEMQDYPIVKRFEITFNYVDKFGEVLMKEIS